MCALLLLGLSALVQSKIRYNLEGKEVELPCMDGALWQSRFTYQNISVVQVTQDVDLFNYCDLHSYKRDNFGPLLVKNGLLPNATSFVLYWDAQKFAGCRKVNYRFRGVQHPTQLANQLGMYSPG